MTQQKCVLCGKPNADMKMFVGEKDKPYIYYHWHCGNNKELTEKYDKRKGD
jgi:hypothetical protein